MGIEKSPARIQNLGHSEMNVQFEFCEQFAIVLSANLWPTKLTTHNYKMHVLYQAKYQLGMNHLEQYALKKALWNKRLEYASELKDDEYELLILNYDANEDALVVEKEGNLVEEEQKTKTPLTLEFKNGENSKIIEEKSCGSCS